MTTEKPKSMSFVDVMLASAQDKRETKATSLAAGVKPQEIEDIMKDIQKKIQGR